MPPLLLPRPHSAPGEIEICSREKRTILEMVNLQRRSKWIAEFRSLADFIEIFRVCNQLLRSLVNYLETSFLHQVPYLLDRIVGIVRGYCFRILHIARVRLIDIFVGFRSLEFRVCAHVLVR